MHHAGPVAWSDATPKQPILAPASTAADAQTSSTAVKEEEQHHGRLLSQAVEIKTETAVLGANVGHKRKREDCVADEAQQRVVVRFSSLPKEALTGAMQASPLRLVPYMAYSPGIDSAFSDYFTPGACAP